MGALTRMTGDAFAVLPTLKSSSVDLVVTDPPFPSIEFHRNIGTTTRLKGRWFPSIKNEQFPALLDQLFRVLKRNTHCYIFVDEETQFVIKTQQITGERFANGAWKTRSGFKYWKSIPWAKLTKDGRYRGDLGYHYRGCVGYIMFFEKGRRPLNSNKEIDLLEGVYRPRKGYPTEKPREVLRTLMLNSSSPGDLVLDPFCGSGASGRCAEALGRTALMIDILPESQTGSSLIAEEN